MKKIFILFLLGSIEFFHAQSSAIIITVDGLDFANTILNTRLKANPNYLQNAVNQMNLGIDKLEIISFEWDGDAKFTDLRIKELRKLLRTYFERAQKQNKKFIVVSHSWGTFLSYMALSFESQVTNPIECDLYITLSSPIGTYYAADLSGYSHLSTWKKILTLDNKVIGFVNQWFNTLKYNQCTNCYPNTKRWINVWAWGDLISGPLSDFITGIEDINVDESSVNQGAKTRNISTTFKWHAFTALTPTGENQILIDNIRKEICSIVDCNLNNDGNIVLGFILDSSGSMTQNDPYNMRKSAMKVIIDQLEGNEKVFIIDFDDNSKWLNSNNWQSINKTTLKQQVDQVNSDGGTNIGRGLDELRKAFESTNVSGKIGVLLLTDGLGDYNNQAEWFRQRNIPIYTISFIGEDNSKLLSEIASLTNGNYLKANTDNEIITAFNQFLNYLKGNAVLTVYKSKISLGERLVSSFFTGSYLRYLFITLVWRGSKIELTLKAPDGTTYNAINSNFEWTDGDNYTFVKIENPHTGKWQAELYGADIPAGGENFNFQVSGDSPTKVELVDKSKSSSSIQFALQTLGSSKISNIKPKIEVFTPKNRKEDISTNFSNNSFNFRPRDGQGNYNFEINLTGKDENGSTIQRYFARTILVGDVLPANIAPIDIIEGNFMTVPLGKDVGNFQGLTCYIYSQGDNEKIAKGFVTLVKETECIIEIQEFLTGSNIKVGDIVELNMEEWAQD